MTARLRSWWQNIRKHWIVAIIIALVIAAIVLILVVSLINGTGFNGYNQVTIAHTISGPSAGTVVRTEVSQPGKTLWDLLQLFAVLAIPVVVGIGAAWFTTQQGKASDAANKQQHETELQIATDNQREAALQAYIDKMSELLLKERLDERTADGKINLEYTQVRNIARVRTITLLTQLDAWRIGYVFTFLREAGLLSTTSSDNVVSLRQAELRGVNWSHANLWGANLSGAYLLGADLSGANLLGADLSGANLLGADLSEAYLWKANLSEASLVGVNLSGANLIEANLSEADLSGANLSGAILGGAYLEGAAGVTVEKLEKQAVSLDGATMPDGSKHL